jgi:hypothetical protein
VSRKGYSPVNAAREVPFGRLKNGMYYDRQWSHVSLHSG